MNSDDGSELTRAVIDRKAEILAELQAPLRERGRQRRSKRSLMAAGVVALIASGLATQSMVVRVPETGEGASPAKARSGIDRGSLRSSSCVEIVAAPHSPVPVELVDDDELFDELRAAGFDCGVVRDGATVVVVAK